MLKINILASNKLFIDNKYIKFQSKRLEYIKIINSLYDVNPIQLSNKIKDIEEDYKKKIHQENKPKIGEFKNSVYVDNYEVRKYSELLSPTQGRSINGDGTGDNKTGQIVSKSTFGQGSSFSQIKNNKFIVPVKNDEVESINNDKKDDDNKKEKEKYKIEDDESSPLALK